MKSPSIAGRSLVDEVTQKLSQEITAGKYKGRELLPPEPDLIARFGVSRTVVREATKQLISHGLVQIQRGRGVKIVKHLHLSLNRSLELSVPNTKDLLGKLLEVRRLIEPAVTRLAALRATAEDVKALKAVQERLKQAPDAATAVELDMEFHRQLIRSAGNPIFELMLESSADLGRESRLATITEVGWQRAYDHHQKIVAAVEKGKPDEAERAMAAHLDVAVVDLRRHFEKSR